MSSVQSKTPQFTKKQEDTKHVESMKLLENDQEMAQIMGLIFKDVSAIITKTIKDLIKDLELMFEDMKESLLKEVDEILGINTTSEAKNSKKVSTRKEWQQRKHFFSRYPGLVEKIVDNSTSKALAQLSKKLEKAEQHSICQDKESVKNTPEDGLTIERTKEAMSEKDCTMLGEVIEESREMREDELFKEIRDGKNLYNVTNKGKISKASKEENELTDEGAVFRFAADFSSATLDVSKQWRHVFNLLRENGFEPEFLCPVKLAFKCDGEMRTFSNLQSLGKFASQKPYMRELLKGFLERKKTKHGRRRYRFREKMDQTITDSKCQAEDSNHDGSHFLFIKEVKAAKSGEDRDIRTQEESSVWKEKDDSELEDSELEQVEEASEFEEEGDETSVLGAEEETSGLEEEEEVEEGDEEVSGSEEEGDVWVFEEEESSHDHPMVDSESGVEVGMVGLEEMAGCNSQKSGALSSTPAFTSGFSSVEISSDEQKQHSWTDESIASGIMNLLKNMEEEERDKPLKTTELQSKGADAMQETKDLGSVISIFRELQEGIGNIKHYHPEVLEIKNSIDALNSRIDIFELRMNNLEDQIEDGSRNSVDPIQMAKHIINKERLRDIEDTSRSANIRLIGIPENYNKENGAEDIIKEIIDENFPELKRDASLEIVSAYRVPSKFDENRLTPRHILVKFWNSHDKEKILRLSREREEITYRGTRIRLTADLSLGTLDARSKWANIIRVLQEEGFKPRILYPAKLAFNFEGKTKIFFDIEEFKDFIICVPSLKGLLENIL